MDVRVLDIVRACNTAAEGTDLFEAIWPRLKDDMDVSISFDGVTDVTSSFVNASIVRLVQKRNFEAIEMNLSISDISKQSADMIRRCVKNATEHKAA